MTTALAAAPADAQQARVQLQLFMVKTVEPSGRDRGRQPITFYLDTVNKKGSEYVCAVAPRVRDAIFSKVHNATYRLDAEGNLDVAAIAAELAPVIREAVGHDLVRGVEVRQGAPEIRAASAVVFQRTGCVSVADTGG